ncbi:MAG: sensor histidine kinase [Bacteroidota bacterium]
MQTFFIYRTKNKYKFLKESSKIDKNKIKQLLKEKELKSFNTILEVQENERERIAKDLHDRLGSILSMVKIYYQSIEKDVEKLNSFSQEQYSKANLLLDHACDEVRKIAYNLGSVILIEFGLIAALEDLMEVLKDTSTIKVNFIVKGVETRLETKKEITIYRIVQELISNVLKHANASNIIIQLTYSKDLINLTVKDNGVGFDLNNQLEYDSMGLKNIKARANQINGKLYIDSNLGKGTRIEIEIPHNELIEL